MTKYDVDYWLLRMLHSYKNVSDLNFTVGQPLQVESAGALQPVAVDPPVRELSAFQTEEFALALINNNARHLRDLASTGSCDLSYTCRGFRFRVNIFMQQKKISVVLRKLESTIPSLEDFNFPAAFTDIASERTGLVLFTGATGTGKTTSLAAILDRINQTSQVQMVTLEDPIEYVHTHKKATINQRELGQDFSEFSVGLRAALRQAPKVILVGEMRDRETMDISMTASETGHLVFSTLHTIDAGQSVNRILGMFSQAERPQIRLRLADTLRWTVSQRLIPRIAGGRVAAMEVMFANLRVKELILNGEDTEKTFYDVITDGSAVGMQTFDQHLLALYNDKEISEENAVSYASRRNVINRGIDRLKATAGVQTSTIINLSLESDN